MTTTAEVTERSDSQQNSGTLVNVMPNKPGRLDPQAGKVGWAILWLLGVPLPVLLIIYLVWER